MARRTHSVSADCEKMLRETVNLSYGNAAGTWPAWVHTHAMDQVYRASPTVLMRTLVMS